MFSPEELAVSKPKRSTGRPRLLNRDAAIETAILLFWRQGYEGTSIAQLTEAMNTTPPSIYTIFGSKEQLYRESVERYMATHGKYVALAFDEEPTAYLAMKRILFDGIKLYCGGPEPLGCMIATSLVAAADDHGRLSDDIAKTRLTVTSFLSQKFGDAKNRGELTVGANPDGLASFFTAVILGTSIQARDGVPPDALELVAKTALNAWPGAI